MRELTDMELDAVSGGNNISQTNTKEQDKVLTGTSNVHVVQQVHQSNTFRQNWR
jgi:hypothetical protein